MEEDFSNEQKRYLEGLASGLQVAKASAVGNGVQAKSDYGVSIGKNPDEIQIEAQNKFLKSGKKLCAEEKAKREHHPFDYWDQMLKNAKEGVYPKGIDVFRYKFHGLFYVAPAQDSFMSRLRMPNGIISAFQFREVAKLASQYGGGYTHVTTRANLQIREIEAKDATDFLLALQDLGLMNRGAGADNIRNVTGNPLSGISTDEIYDTRELARELHYYILYHRDMYGLPRKFNIAFDGGGAVSVLEDTNDIGFAAVRVEEDQGVEPGVFFRMQLGGITGHEDFARDTGILLTPEQCVSMAKAVIRVFIENGDRTDRTKARLKYVLDEWGFDKFMQVVEEKCDFEVIKFPLEKCIARKSINRMAHVGVHEQKQENLSYIGVVCSVGRLEAEQMHGLADIAEQYGSGCIRLTVWQNLIISDIKHSDIETVKQKIEQLGLHWSASNIRANLISCTGNWGCKFANSNTKLHASVIADHVECNLELDQPINIHLTGCHHSCAQHYIGDIGLLATKVDKGEDEDPAEGYDVYLGGGFADKQAIAKEFMQGVDAELIPQLILNILDVYMQHRKSKDELFFEFAARNSCNELLELLQQKDKAA
ncbi:MAG: NirA family protein [Pseudomonadota bacterium]